MDITKAKQDDFFVPEDLDQKVLKKVEEKKTVPGNYIKIKLSSCGKLSAPAILHFRNYTMDETVELAGMTEHNRRETMISVLNKLIFEDFDCNDLHTEEVKEILLNLNAAFWGPNLESTSFKYFINENLPDDQLNKPGNTSVAKIPIKNIKVNELPKEFKEPFYIVSEDSKDRIGFKLPKFNSSIISNSFLEEKYITEEKKFSELRYILRYNKYAPKEEKKSFSMEEFSEYEKYMQKKNLDQVKILGAQLLDSVNGKVFNSLHEKYEFFKKLDLRVWETLNEFIEGLNYGVDEIVEFKCSVNNTLIKRRFQFREYDFLPSMDSKRIKKYSVSFG